MIEPTFKEVIKLIPEELVHCPVHTTSVEGDNLQLTSVQLTKYKGQFRREQNESGTKTSGHAVPVPPALKSVIKHLCHHKLLLDYLDFDYPDI